MIPPASAGTKTAVRLLFAALAILALALGAVNLLGIRGLLTYSPAWRRFLLTGAFAHAALICAVNAATLQIASTVIDRLSGRSCEDHQRLANGLESMIRQPAGCLGDVCASALILALIVTQIVLLFMLAKKPTPAISRPAL